MPREGERIDPRRGYAFMRAHRAEFPLRAMCESFFATLECELIWRRSFRTAAETRREVFGFIEGFYNTRRLHSALGYRSPADYEGNRAA